MFIDGQRALVVAPHQDDEIIGCGGTIALLRSMGIKVSVVHVFMGSSGIEGLDEGECSRIRHQEALNSASILDYEVLSNLGFPDRLISETTEITKSLIKVFREIQPNLIFGPHDEEKDLEHQLVSKAVWEAFWLSKTATFADLGNPNTFGLTVLGYEVWSPIKKVSLYFDISNFIDSKTEALNEFKSQNKDNSWVKGAIGLNAYRGTTIMGYGYAEAFTVKNANLMHVSQFLTQAAKP
jgi:N-acetylglucosamine malate deacetylase 1